MWNIFDFSIFVLFMTFYALRIAGIITHNARITAWSFDVLASCSIFLFPRIFSVLDHYQYFSQLIVAFRTMAADMVALLVLIVVSCSGFFVAFTFSFAREYSSAADVSYGLFQMLMGYTPAVRTPTRSYRDMQLTAMPPQAWETWSRYNVTPRNL